jgi:hypothetical protein
VKVFKTARVTPDEVKAMTDAEWEWAAANVEWSRIIPGVQTMNPPRSAESKALIVKLLEEQAHDDGPGF